jgi:hypothetical protein
MQYKRLKHKLFQQNFNHTARSSGTGVGTALYVILFDICCQGEYSPHLCKPRRVLGRDRTKVVGSFFNRKTIVVSELTISNDQK